MKYLIISSHPYAGSFNAGIAEMLKKTAKTKGHDVSEINLVADNFNPVMTPEDLRAWGKGEFVDPQVKIYQAEIENADVLIIPFPIWWGAMPAILKGFCDKVLLPGWAYIHGSGGEMIGQLTDKKAIVITTMETPVDVFETYFGNPVHGAFLKDTLQSCGIDVINYKQIDKIASGGREHADAMMKEVGELIK